MASLNRLADCTIERLAENLTGRVGDLNDQQVAKVILSEMQQEKSIYAVVMRDGEKIVEGKTRDGNWQIIDAGEGISGRFLTKSRDIIQEAAKLGTIELYLTPRFIHAELTREILKLVVAIIFLDIFSFIFLTITLRKMVLRPLTRLLTMVNAISDGDFTQDIAIRRQDEIGELSGGFRRMKETIAKVLLEMDDLLQAMQEGRLENQGNAELFAGDWRELVAGVNSGLEVFMTQVTMMESSLDRISMGDISETITAEYNGDFNTIKLKLNMMLTIFNEVVITVKTAADSVVSRSQELNSSSTALSQGVTQQAAMTGKVSASMEEMTATIRQSADNALQTEKIAVKSVENARESGQAVAETMTAIKKIAKTTAIIEKISLQTRMLSLNASIEAAKAQEYGKGFAVVASEVRQLAKRCQLAAEEINTLVSSSVVIAEDAGERLARLVPNIEKTAELIQEISAASSEQRTSADHINQAIQQFDLTIQQNSIATEEVVLTTEALIQQAEQLQGTFEFFSVDPAVLETLDERKQALIDSGS